MRLPLFAEYLKEVKAATADAPPLMEAFKSNILAQIATSMSFKYASKMGGLKTVYSKYKFNLADVTDSDVVTITPQEATRKPYTDSAWMVFFINNNVRLFKQDDKVGLVGITVGGAFDKTLQGLVLKYMDDPYRIGGDEHTELNRPNAKNIRFNKLGLAEYADICYAINLDVMASKYSVDAIRAARAEAKAGVVPDMPAASSRRPWGSDGLVPDKSKLERYNKKFRDDNIARYKVLAARKLDPKSVFAEYQAIFSDVSMKIAKRFSEINIDNLIKPDKYFDGVDEDWMKFYFNDESRWTERMDNLMSSMVGYLSEYIRRYAEYVYYLKKLDSIDPEDTQKVESYQTLTDSALVHLNNAEKGLSALKKKIADIKD